MGKTDQVTSLHVNIWLYTGSETESLPSVTALYSACENRRFLFVILFYRQTYGVDKCSIIAC